jgi:hydrogenase nickel incorporation protein HypA/HybF
MHELSIAQSILEIVRQNLPLDREVSVSVVRLRIGVMAGVIPDSLEFCFSAIAQGTPAEGAALEIEHVPLTARCAACGRESAIEPTRFICPLCGSNDLTVAGGREMQVREIEIADGNGSGP